MKPDKTILLPVLIFLINAVMVHGQMVDKKKSLLAADYISLNGEALSKGNAIAPDGNVHKVKLSLLRIKRSKSTIIKGTVLVLPGGGYEVLRWKNEGIKSAAFLNALGFDVVILDYPIARNTPMRDSALGDALKAYHFLKAKRSTLGLRGDRMDILGCSSGGHLAARLVQQLGANDQPDNLLLLSPLYLDEYIKGTVYPAVMPPVQPHARLFASFSYSDNKAWVNSCTEYAKVWKGYDGEATFYLSPDSSNTNDKDVNPFEAKLKLPVSLKDFLTSTPVKKDSSSNPAAIAVAGYNKNRHEQKLQLLGREKFDLVMMGNSITNNFEKPEFQPVWNQFFAPRKAINLGFSAYRTENIIWNIEHGELDGQSPKVLVLEIGTNNIDEKNYPTRHTAGELAGGFAAIVKRVRQKLPATKIILLRCFPGNYGGPNPTSHRAILERASDMVSKLADGKDIFYCDVNHVFLNFDGSINHDLLPDWLHPNPEGAKRWAQAMEPLLSRLMGDKSRDTAVVANTAIIPVSRLEEDSYNWWDRHAEALRIKDSIDPEIVLIGNSITHFWGGQPKLKYTDGRSRNPNGPNSWASIFGQYRVLNLGFGWDRTQNVLWRLDHGEIDGLHPKSVVILIGTNNTTGTQNARMNTAAEIIEGIQAICLRTRSKLPMAKIIVMAVFPREKDPASPRRVLINEINRLLEAFTKEHQLTYADVGPRMLAGDGTFLPGIMLDYTHPTDKGYQVWAEGIRPLLEKSYY